MKFEKICQVLWKKPVYFYMDLDSPRVDTSPSMVYTIAPKVNLDQVRQQLLVGVKSETFSSGYGEAEPLCCITLIEVIIIFTGLPPVSLH